MTNAELERVKLLFEVGSLAREHGETYKSLAALVGRELGEVEAHAKKELAPASIDRPKVIPRQQMESKPVDDARRV